METKNKNSTPTRFKINLIDLVDIIKDISSESTDNVINSSLLEILKQYIKGLNTSQIELTLISFIKNTHEYWSNQIYNRDKEFFIENKLKILPKYDDYMQKINKVISQCNTNDTDIIWEYIHVFVKQSIKFIHEKRVPTHILHKNQYKKVYSNTFMKMVPISKYASQWNLNLEWEQK